MRLRTLFAVTLFFALSLTACDKESASDPTAPSTDVAEAGLRAATTLPSDGLLRSIPGTATPQPSTSTPPPGPLITTALVVRVIDGDTVVLEDGSQVRYLGIDTPETTSQQECFGQEASSRNRELVKGRVVELEKDVSETDQSGRLLRYVYVDGLMVNAALVLEGLAQVSTSSPDVKHEDKFLEAQRHAVGAGAGQWSRCQR